jgi:hypothetical protein
MQEFGYIETDDPKPMIRLACQAQAYGAISIVIPPWNGILGRLRRPPKDAAKDPPSIFHGRLG